MGRIENADFSLPPPDSKLSQSGGRESNLTAREFQLPATMGNGADFDRSQLVRNRKANEIPLNSRTIGDFTSSLTLTNLTIVDNGQDLLRKQRSPLALSEVVPAPPRDLLTSAVDASAEAQRRESFPKREFGPNVIVDAKNQISKITYPDENKTREFSRDEYGEINKLVTTTPRGQFNYVKEDGRWFYLESGKNKRPFDAMALDAHGEFSRVVRDGVALTQRPDGTSVEEEVSALGVRMTRNEEGQPEIIKRPDGSQVNALYENGNLVKLVENEGDKSVSWTPDKAGRWISDEQPSHSVQNLRVERNGNLRYSAENVKYIVRSNGAEIEEGPGHSKFSFDEQGRFRSITSPDGKNTTSFSYAGADDEPSRIQVIEREKNETRSYIHEPEKGGWTRVNKDNQAMGTWKGEVKIGDDGTYSIKATGTKGDAWTVYHTDGTTQKECRRQNGTLAVTNSAGDLKSATRVDGTVLKADYDAKGLSVLSQQNRNGDKVNWQRQQDGTWKSDSPDFPGALKNVTVNLDGEISIVEASQDRTTLKADGSSHMEKADGSFVDADRNWMVRRVGIDNQNYRTLDYKDGRLSKVTDITTSGTKVWQRKPDGQEERQDIQVSSDGYVSYKVDGKTIVEGSNLSKMELNNNLSPSHVSLPNGASRDYKYDHSGSLQSITDRRVTANETKAEVWKKVAQGENGSNRFENRTRDGKVQVRNDVYVDESGDYLYRSNDGRAHAAPVRDLIKGGRQSQESRREQPRLADGDRPPTPTDRLPSIPPNVDSQNEATDHSFQLKGYMLPSPDQLGAGSCLYMSATGIAEFLLNKSKGIVHPQVGGPTDLSEQWTINLSKRVQLGNNYTDAPELLARAGAIPDSRLKFKAYAGSTWMNEAAFGMNGTEALPAMKKEVLFNTGGEGSQQSYGRMRPGDLEKIKQYLRNNESPVLFVYKPPTANWWHANIITGYDDKTQTFTVRDSSFGNQVVDAPAYNYDGRSPYGPRQYRNETKMPYYQVLQWGNHATGYKLANQPDAVLASAERPVVSHNL